MKKRLLSIIVAFAVAFGLTAFLPEENDIINVDTVEAASRMTLDQLKAKFPSGKHWNHYVSTAGTDGDSLRARGDNSYGDSLTDYPCATHSTSGSVGQYDCNCFDGGEQCCGFARRLAYDAFGSYASGWGLTSVGSLKAGDVVHYYGNGADAQDGHWVFITSVNGDSVTVGECNYSVNDHCVINWGRSVPKSWFNNAKIYSAPSELTTSNPVAHNPHAVVTIPEGEYNIVNVGTGRYMNYGYGWRSTPKAICEAVGDGTPEQKFRVKHAGNKKYELYIMHSDGGVVNSWCDSTAGDGTALTYYKSVNDDTQRYYFCKEGDHYYITSATNKDAVVTAPGKVDGQLTHRYYTGSKDQQWKLIPLNVPNDDLIENPNAPETIADGDYELINVGTGRYMNYGHGWRSSPKAICESVGDGTPEQTFRIKNVGNKKYEIYILHSDGGVVNAYCDAGSTVTPGVLINRLNKVEGDESRYYFCKASTAGNDCYYIANSTNKNVVMTAPGKVDGQLTFEKYYGDVNQQWKLIPVGQKEEDDPPVVTTNFYRGIDVSGFQKEIDWAAVKKSGQAEFAIIRAGTTLNDDTETFYNDARFEQNYEGAKNAGIKIGLYYYCGATTQNGFINCANELIEYLDGKKAEYPVYIDVEASQAQMNMGKAVLTEYLMSALKIIKNAGYKAGVYASQSWFTSYIDKSALQSAGYEIWQARWPSATSAVDPSGYDESAECGIWQYSSKGSISGISGNVDVDVSYIDYSKTAAPTPFTPNADINRDNTVDEVDIFILSNHLKGKKISDSYRKNADINGDGKINVFDLVLMKRLISKK